MSAEKQAQILQRALSTHKRCLEKFSCPAGELESWVINIQSEKRAETARVALPDNSYDLTKNVQ